MNSKTALPAGRNLKLPNAKRAGSAILVPAQECMPVNVAQKTLCADLETEKAIRRMGCMQRKRHQRQFAVVHFLLHGMVQFVEELDLSQKKCIMIVCDEKTVQAARFLATQIEEMEKMSVALKPVLYTAHEFNKLPREFDPHDRIIYIGDFPQSRKLWDHITYWRFSGFGFRYGWFGGEAVISFCRTPSRDEFRQMVEIAQKDFAKLNDPVDMLTMLEGSFWNELSTAQKTLLVAGAVVAVALVGAGAAALVDNHKRKKETDRMRDKDISSDSCACTSEHLTREELDELGDKTSKDPLTDEEWDYISQSEYGEEWLDRDVELRDMSLDAYDDMRSLEDYGLDDEDMDCGDEEPLICEDH